ncbi:MAG: hypothetical protein ACTS44_00965 [Candidatus Hodgkinia cicadicola]
MMHFRRSWLELTKAGGNDFSEVFKLRRPRWASKLAWEASFRFSAEGLRLKVKW